MEAKVEEIGDVYVIHLVGQLDFESADSFRSTCIQHFTNKKVIFNLRALSFVGSSGITPFLETMTQLSKSQGGHMKLCGVGSEFLRVFEASEVHNVEIYEDEFRARMAFQGYPIAPTHFISPIDRVQQPFGLDHSIQEEASSSTSSEDPERKPE